MNTYKKYCPNVFVAKCSEEHKKGDVIILTTKYGKENEHIVYNLIGKDSESFYYSITRKDGFDSQQRAKNKVEKLSSWANSAPESIEFFKIQLAEAEKYHAEIKSGLIKKEHAYSLIYMKKKCNELKKQYEIAVMLWG